MASAPFPRRRWRIANAAAPTELAALGVPDPLLAQVLHNRGLRTREDVASFTDPASEAEPSPFVLPGMHEAVAMLRWAVSRQKRIVIYGDYDVDGLAATALMLEALQAQGADVRPYIPNRLETGYGLDSGNIDDLAGATDLLVTVDCGVRSLEEVAHARKRGMRVIVTDHHLPGPELPQADAVVCSRLADAYSDAAGVGVAAMVIQALGAVGSRFGADREAGGRWSDLVALGTVADIAPLLGTNRGWVRAGLKELRKRPRPGIVALSRSAGVELSRLGAWQISFVLAPRINAAGRLGSAQPALDLLLARDAMRAAVLAQRLERANDMRKEQLERDVASAVSAVEADMRRPRLLFTADESYAPGLVGLIASRLAESQGLPAVAVAVEDGVARGSMRSTPELNASRALDACSALLTKHGGHSAAAGFSCPVAALPELRAELERLAGEVIGGDDRRPMIEIDAETPLLGSGEGLWDWLPLLEPTGTGNPRPVFVSRDVRVHGVSTMGRQGAHASLVLGWHGETIRAVAWRVGSDFTGMPERIDAVYQLDENAYNGSVERRLELLDWAPAAG